jgi:hypothetical protein
VQVCFFFFPFWYLLSINFTFKKSHKKRKKKEKPQTKCSMVLETPGGSRAALFGWVGDHWNVANLRQGTLSDRQQISKLRMEECKNATQMIFSAACGSVRL